MSEPKYIEVTITRRVKLSTLKSKKTNLLKKLDQAHRAQRAWANDEDRFTRELAEIEASLAKFTKNEEAAKIE